MNMLIKATQSIQILELLNKIDKPVNIPFD